MSLTSRSGKVAHAWLENGFAPALWVRCSAISPPALARGLDRNRIEVVDEQRQGGAELPAGDLGLIEFHSLHLRTLAWRVRRSRTGLWALPEPLDVSALRVTIPRARNNCAPRRGQSVPRPA